MEFEELKEYEYLDNSPDVHVQRHFAVYVAAFGTRWALMSTHLF